MTVDLEQRPYNPGYGWYEAKVVVEGHPVMVYVSGRRNASVDVLTEWADGELDWIVRHLAQLRSKVSSELLESRNEDWVDESRPPVSAAAFERELHLGAVRLHANGDLELSLAAGSLFRGHPVVVWLDPAHTPTGTYLDG